MTIVDATLIAAPPSTKSRYNERDAEMHQSKKGNFWHFGMKVDVDVATGLVHSLVCTSGNVADVTQAHALLHGGEKAVLGDAGYQGVGWGSSLVLGNGQFLTKRTLQRNRCHSSVLMFLIAWRMHFNVSYRHPMIQ